MPFKLRRRRRQNDWNGSDRDVLVYGLDILQLPGDDGPSFKTLDDPLAAQAWEDLGSELKDEHIRKSPGTRPAAQWIFDIFPEHGLRLQTAFDDWGIEPEDATRPPKPFDGFETSQEYLRRNGLLETHESFRLATPNNKRSE